MKTLLLRHLKSFELYLLIRSVQNTIYILYQEINLILSVFDFGLDGKKFIF